jgi:multidrug efflux pump subunit AcrB
LPVNKLPDKIDKKTKFADFYNKTLGSEWFVNSAKPLLNSLLGGSLRYFTDFVSENARYSDPGRTTLNIYAKMPEGCTIEQMNETLKKMENFLSKFDQIQMFKTVISSARYGSISIFFKPKYEMSSFPYYLKNVLIKKAISLGGADWSIFGLGKGFSNSLNLDLKMEHIELTGYNYDKLMKYAEKLRTKILQNPRIDDVDITGYASWFSSAIHEFILTPKEREDAMNKIYLSQIYKPLANILFDNKIYNAYYQGSLYPVVLKSSENKNFDFWYLRNYPLFFGNKYQKVPNLASVKFVQKNNTIYRINQVYRLVLNYNYNGSPYLSDKAKKSFIKYISSILPLGFTCQKNDYYYYFEEITSKNNFLLLLFIIMIIYFICSILFESFNQPFTIIFMIPVSFIGIFLIFIFFKFGFDQGGFASFILLSGITVNSGIYIINDFNRYGNKTVHYYVKAFNYKIYPILLTILSTILGLLPFIYNGKNDTFWFSFAIGAIGGLVFSLISIFIYLPLFLKMKKD